MCVGGKGSGVLGWGGGVAGKLWVFYDGGCLGFVLEPVWVVCFELIVWVDGF